jgi:hypothetical protein
MKPADRAGDQHRRCLVARLFWLEQFEKVIQRLRDWRQELFACFRITGRYVGKSLIRQRFVKRRIGGGLLMFSKQVRKSLLK